MRIVIGVVLSLMAVCVRRAQRSQIGFSGFDGALQEFYRASQGLDRIFVGYL